MAVGCAGGGPLRRRREIDGWTGTGGGFYAGEKRVVRSESGGVCGRRRGCPGDGVGVQQAAECDWKPEKVLTKPEKVLKTDRNVISRG